MEFDNSYALQTLENMPGLPVASLGDVVRPVLGQSVANLLTMSGTPQQVLANQFVAYASGLTILTETLKADEKPFAGLRDALVRIPEKKSK